MPKNQVENSFFLNDLEEDEEVVTESVYDRVSNVESEFRPDTFGDCRFSPGIVSWKKRDGKLVRLFQPGVILDKTKINKFFAANKELVIESASNPLNISRGYQLFEDLRRERFEKERVEAREKILVWIKDLFWDDQEQGNLLDLIAVCERSFYQLDNELEEKLLGMSRKLYHRSAFVSSLAVVLALSMGYNDHRFLQDVYHLSYVVDYGLHSDGMSWNLERAMEGEYEKAGGGVAVLSKDEEAVSFSKHVEDSLVAVSMDCGGLFNEKGFERMILRHHERTDGTGFPGKLNSSEMSDIENIVIFCGSCVREKYLEYKLGDGTGFLKGLISDRDPELVSILSPRLKLLVFKVFESMGTGDEQYSEFAEV